MSQPLSPDEARTILEVEPDAEADEIQAAFQREAQASYPNPQEKFKGDEAEFVRVRTAYETLMKEFREESEGGSAPGVSKTKLWQDLTSNLMPEKAIRTSSRTKWAWPSEISPPEGDETCPGLSIVFDGASSWFDADRPLPRSRQTLFKRSAYPSNAKHFCLLTIDTHELFFRFPIDGATSRRSTFLSPTGQVYEWLVLHKGIPGAAAQAEAALEALLVDVDCKTAGMEVVIYTCGGELHHIDTVNEALRTLRAKGLELKRHRGLLGAKFPELFRVCNSPDWETKGSENLYPDREKQAEKSGDDADGKGLPPAAEAPAAVPGPSAAAARKRTNNKKNKGQGKHKQEPPKEEEALPFPANTASRKKQKQVRDLKRYHNQQNRGPKKPLPQGDPWAAPADGPYLVMVCILSLSGFLMFVVLVAVFRILFGV